ncbi:putative leucine-rich repeat domain, L domain-containing protein [Rosa chinensis]|uniref:Putative leucine-rich repeat domain, L domain-containing protein n=1 Tax=Rosa chinensis TaxID=74649 RepID=A0A2P6R5R5_ROSCH|nr:putative leucine-rich repeat domain, L domain-containing protein [Rosa chinensis]
MSFGLYLLSLQSLSLTRMDFLDSSHSTGALGVDLFSGYSFPCLKKLNIKRCRGMSDLKISCRNLKDIRVFDMGLKSMDISGMRLEGIDISFCFANCINGSWVNIFGPNLKSFAWMGNGITDKFSIRSFPALKRSNFFFAPH